MFDGASRAAHRTLDAHSARALRSPLVSVTWPAIFSFRKRTILPDDLLRWHGDTYEIVHIDEYDHRGREIRVRGREILLNGRPV